MKRPSIIAHRGASGYEYENSRAAFRRAILLDADGIELDVHTTRDGAVVVHHDAALGDLGLISQLSLAEVREHRLRNGETVPLLAEALAIAGDHDVWVEVKTLGDSHDGALIEVLDAGPAPARYAVHSFDHRIVHRIGQARPALRRGCLLSAYLLDPVAALRATGATVLWQEWEQVDQELVNAVHNADCAIVAWTVNQVGDVAALARLGVDALCGNYPDRIRAALAPAAGDVVST